MNRAGLLLLLAACGHSHDIGSMIDGHGSGDRDSSTGDGSGDGNGDGNGDVDAAMPDATGDGPLHAIPLTACGSSVEIATTLPTALNFDVIPNTLSAPHLLSGDSARIFYTATGDQMTSAHGSAATVPWPSQLAGATYVSGQRSGSGGSAVVFLVGNVPMASRVIAGVVEAPLAIPCAVSEFFYACDVRLAGDGHLWVRSGQHLFEQTPQGFADRGGAPEYPNLFDVNYEGDVLIASTGTTPGEAVQVWALPHGAAGWTKRGALPRSAIGGHAVAELLGTLAPDGSIHVMTSLDATEPQILYYARSRDGATWAAEALPPITMFTDGQAMIRDAAFWASDYDNVRFAVVSAFSPQFQRQLNAIVRCSDAGTPRFERAAKVRFPGWTEAGWAGFSETGQITFLTRLGVTQAYR